MEDLKCLVEDCNVDTFQLNLCTKHYTRFYRYGDVNYVSRFKREEFCSVDDCNSKVAAKNLCHKHLWRLKKYGTLEKPRKILQRELPCIVDNCIKKRSGKGYCDTHLKRFNLYGDANKEDQRINNNTNKYKNRITSDGYVKVHCPAHPNADKAGNITEHRLIMSIALGRALLEFENVHHKNGNRQDNRIENLELWASFQPSGQRAEDLLEYAEVIIELYGDYRDKVNIE